MSLGKPEIKQCHMEDDMALFATDQATNALAVMFHEQVSNQRNRANNHCFGCEQQVAQFMKNQFEKKFKSNWHCIVGKLQTLASAGKKNCCFLTTIDI